MNATIQPQIDTDLSAFGGLTQIGLNTKKSQNIKNYNLGDHLNYYNKRKNISDDQRRLVAE